MGPQQYPDDQELKWRKPRDIIRRASPSMTPTACHCADSSVAGTSGRWRRRWWAVVASAFLSPTRLLSKQLSLERNYAAGVRTNCLVFSTNYLLLKFQRISLFSWTPLDFPLKKQNK